MTHKRLELLLHCVVFYLAWACGRLSYFWVTEGRIYGSLSVWDACGDSWSESCTTFGRKLGRAFVKCQTMIQFIFSRRRRNKRTPIIFRTPQRILHIPTHLLQIPMLPLHFIRRIIRNLPLIPFRRLQSQTKKIRLSILITARNYIALSLNFLCTSIPYHIHFVLFLCWVIGTSPLLLRHLKQILWLYFCGVSVMIYFPHVLFVIIAGF